MVGIGCGYKQTKAQKRFYLRRKTMFTNDLEDFLEASIKSSGSFYPPYNTYNEGDSTFIEMAVTGFDKSELSAYFDDEGLFVVEGKKTETKDDDSDKTSERQYFERNLSMRNFTRKFQTPKNTELGEITAKNGLLTVEFKRVKPKFKYLEIK